MYAHRVWVRCVGAVVSRARCVLKLTAWRARTSLRDGCRTWAYSAPEVRLFRRPYTDKIDCWSLGVILYVMLSGTRSRACTCARTCTGANCTGRH
ncbi:hypothetical protein EON67_11405, partial [archaeon]